jgi:magnesium transporter
MLGGVRSGSMSVSGRLYRDGHPDPQPVDLGTVGDVCHQPGTLVWLDVASPTNEDIEVLRAQFGFHELALEDSVNPHQRPKIEQYDDYFFCVAYGVSVANERLVKHEVAMFISGQYLVTVRKDPALDLQPVLVRWDTHPQTLREGAGALLYMLLDEIVDDYFKAVDALEERSEDVEESVLADSADSDIQSRIFLLKKDLIGLRRIVTPLRDVLDVLQRQIVPVVTMPLEPYYRDVYDHVLRVTDLIETLRDTLSNALDAHLSAVSNRLNEVMKTLTSWAAIILVPTFVAGVYGMNFDHMPELHWRYGYLGAVGVMALSAVLLYRMFKRRRWL